MKAVAALLIAGALCSSAWSETGFLDRSTTLHGKTYSFQVYVPLDYTSAKVWPIIVYLHGNGHQGSDGMRQTKAAFADAIRDNRALFPAIVVLPQAAEGRPWSDSDMQELVMQELNQTADEFYGDRGRFYLTGFSMGGTGAYRIAYHHPDTFAAVVVVAGRIEPPSRFTPEDIANDRRANPFLASADPFASLSTQLKGIRVWIFHGDQDEAIAVEQSRHLVAALKIVGANVKYTEYPGANHVGAAEKAYTETEMIQWLFQQHRDVTPGNSGARPSSGH